METIAVIANGLMSFLKESMMERSDGSRFGLNLDTKNFAYKHNDLNNYFTTDNQNNLETNNYSLVDVPYAFKLLTQELEGFGISTKLFTNKKDIEEEEIVTEYLSEADDEEDNDE
jgi:DNA-directed RNA polymerase beta subunit